MSVVTVRLCLLDGFDGMVVVDVVDVVGATGHSSTRDGTTQPSDAENTLPSSHVRIVGM